MYRLGWPLALYFASFGVPLVIKVEIIHDDEANVYVATSNDLHGLIVEAETLDELEKEVIALTPELLALNNPRFIKKSATHLSFSQPLVRV